MAQWTGSQFIIQEMLLIAEFLGDIGQVSVSLDFCAPFIRTGINLFHLLHRKV